MIYDRKLLKITYCLASNLHVVIYIYNYNHCLCFALATICKLQVDHEFIIELSEYKNRYKIIVLNFQYDMKKAFVCFANAIG